MAVMAAEYSYSGRELELFDQARNWKAYLASKIGVYLVGHVLEVGAGIGATTRVLCDGLQKSWTAIEPDPSLARQLRTRLQNSPLPVPVAVKVGTTGDLLGLGMFDAILYIDVLEHIEDDRGELLRAASMLSCGGSLIVLAPAHQWLYTPFDREIGHYRRYSKVQLKAAAPASLRMDRLIYLDAVGMIASLGNRLILNQGAPTTRQIWLWDSWMVRLSRYIDPLLRYAIGKSVFGVWRKP
jgi:hypothetical protein